MRTLLASLTFLALLCALAPGKAQAAEAPEADRGSTEEPPPPPPQEPAPTPKPGPDPTKRALALGVVCCYVAAPFAIGVVVFVVLVRLAMDTNRRYGSLLPVERTEWFARGGAALRAPRGLVLRRF